MGQYYKAILLANKPQADKPQADKPQAGREIIRLWSSPHDYGYGSKLMEHVYFDNYFVLNLEYQLSPEGMFHQSRVVWAGDYAEEEQEQEQEGDLETKNLYYLCKEDSTHRPLPHHDTHAYPYVVNHTTKQYVDKKKENIHPLPLLTAEGNGAGGGDYRGDNEYLCGSWARHVISVEKEPPAGYEELICAFEE